MPDFNVKMHQNRFRLVLCPRPPGGAYSAPPDSLAGFKGPTSKGREGEGREGKGREGKGEGEGREGQGRGVQCVPYFSRCLLATLSGL